MKIILLIFFLFFFSCKKDSPSGPTVDQNISGCTDADAANYDAIATIDDGSCEFKHFNLLLDETGESTLFIFLDSITALEVGDELGLFDLDGITDNQGNIGEMLVGTGTWNSNQLEIATILSIDNTSFGGSILPGSISGNNMILKVWDISEEVEYHATYDIQTGTGTFDDFFTAIEEINFE